MNVIAWISAVPGVAALIAFFVGYGALLNRVKNVESDVVNIQRELAELRATRETVARIDERTKATQDQVGRMDGKLDGALTTLLGETRTWRDRERSLGGHPA
jgi:hypothetical protein